MCIRQYICVEQLDLVVILDTSKSVGEKNFQKCIFFLEGVVANLSIAPDSVRVALLRYSDKAQVVSYLNDDMEKQEKLKAVGSIQYIEGSTYTDLALELTNEEVLSPERGDRSNVSDLVVLITDGESSNKSSTKNQSVKLKNRNNLKIFTLGIGSEIDDEELEAIATSNDLSLILESFENLAEIIAPMTSVTCSGGSVLDPTEPFNEQTTELGDQSTHLSDHTTQSNYSTTYSSAQTTHLSDQTTHLSDSTTPSRAQTTHFSKQTTQLGDQNRPTDQITVQIKYPTIQSNDQTTQLNDKTQTMHSSEPTRHSSDHTAHSNNKLTRSRDQTTYSSVSTRRPSASRDQVRQPSYLATRQRYSNAQSRGLTTQSYIQTTKSRKRITNSRNYKKLSNNQTTHSNYQMIYSRKLTTYAVNQARQTYQTRRRFFLNTQSIDLATQSSSVSTQSSSLTTQSSSLTTQSSGLATQSSGLTTHSNIQTTKSSNRMAYSSNYYITRSNHYTTDSKDYMTQSNDQKVYLNSPTTRLTDRAVYSSSTRTLAGGRSRELDLIIILDTSVREDCFMANINFTETLLEELPISSDLVRVALGYHSHQVQIASYLNESTNKEDKLKEVLRMKELTLSQTLNKSSQISQLDVLEGDRSDVADIIMFIKSDLFISSNLTINETKIYSIGVLNISNAQDWLKASNLSNVSFIVDSFTSPKDVANYLMTTSTSGITTRRYLVVTVHQRTSFQNLEIELSDKPVGDVNNATFLTYLGISIAIIVAALAIVVALATLYRKKQNKNCADNP
ncbi:serine-rich adhesin for platelets-like isoform X2 [Biomphalaria glabrata]|uniref:Serine-rich adhesin for platelets-like isoform X2 n=1 Tax=Biomphalaria glabrata TaxID=6526 RepID=A0A9W3A4F6_BIOGL|nr:serine-rich adhesin for platelets-like isoform X2 [Biomphalaria glabrata]